MDCIAKKIIIDELTENTHIEKAEDVIFWALAAYGKQNKTNGGLIARAIVQRIKDKEEEDEDEGIKPDGYECTRCGNIQNNSNGFGCDRCASPLQDWYC